MPHVLILFAIVTLLSACARPPHLEMDAAAYLVDRARERQAQAFAPTEYQSAQTALDDARQAMQQADYGKARDSLNFALKHARRALTLAEEQHARLAAAEEAQRALEVEQGRQAILKTQAREAASSSPAPAPPKKPDTPPQPRPAPTPVTSHTVAEGETLWTVSAQPQVYNDGLLWPLLYRANRDQIKDPRQIAPGQILSIRRDMTEKDLDDARQRARESDVFTPSGAVVPAQ